MSGQLPDLSLEERQERVLSVVRAARRLADPNDRLGREARRALPAVTGLSVAGVELGLSRHIETSVSAEDLQQLVARAGSAPRVHVVLSANVFVGVVRAVALAVAVSRSVRVRPSSREAVLAPLLLQALADQPHDVRFELCRDLEPISGDEVHVYGRRQTIEAISAEIPAGVRVRGHGPGFGVAVIDPRTVDSKLAAERLSWDVVPFDQRGCLSPRLALVDGSDDEVEIFARALFAELTEREREVPRGVLDEEERKSQALYRQTMHTVGRCHDQPSFAVGVDLRPRTLFLPPTGRHVHVARTSAEDLPRLLEPFRGAITSVGSTPGARLAEKLLCFAEGARSSPLGVMQRPPLDGPADRRDMV